MPAEGRAESNLAGIRRHGFTKQMRPDPATTNALLALFVTFQLDKNRLKK